MTIHCTGCGRIVPDWALMWDCCGGDMVPTYDETSNDDDELDAADDTLSAPMTPPPLDTP